MFTFVKTKPLEAILCFIGLLAALWFFGLIGVALISDASRPPWYVIMFVFYAASLITTSLLWEIKSVEQIFWIGTIFFIVVTAMTVAGYFFVSWLVF